MESTPPKSYFFSFPGCASRGFLSSSLGAGTACQRPAGVRRTWAGRSPEVPTTRFQVLHSRKSHPHISLPSSPPVTHQPSATSHLSPRTFHYSSPVIDHPPPITITHHPSFRQPAISSVSLPSHHFHHYYSYLPPINHQLSATCGHSFISPHRSPVTHYSPLITHHSPFISQQTVARLLARPLCDDNRPSDERPST